MNLTPSPLTGNASVRFSNRTAKLLVQITTVANTSSGTLTEVQAFLSALDAAVTIEVQKSHGSYGTKTVLYRHAVSKYMEVAAANEGYFVVNNVGGKAVLVGTIELSETGSIVPMEGEVYEINFSGLSTVYTALVNTLDSPVDAVTCLNYGLQNLNPNSVNMLNIAEANILAVPVAGLNTVELEYFGGKKCSFTAIELQAVCREVNELVFVYGGLISGIGNSYYSIPVGLAAKAHINTTTQGVAVVVNEKPL